MVTDYPNLYLRQPSSCLRPTDFSALDLARLAFNRLLDSCWPGFGAVFALMAVLRLISIILLLLDYIYNAVRPEEKSRTLLQLTGYSIQGCVWLALAVLFSSEDTALLGGDSGFAQSRS